MKVTDRNTPFVSKPQSVPADMQTEAEKEGQLLLEQLEELEKARKDSYEKMLSASFQKTSSSSSFYEKAKLNQYEKYKYSHSTNMSRLAGARSISEVRWFINAKHGEIRKVKLLVQDSAEAARIIRKLKSVIQSGNIKISRLRKEENLALQKRLAAKREKVRLEKQIAEQLRKKRTARKAQERCQTADFDDVLGKPSLQEMQYQKLTESFAKAASPLVQSTVSASTSEASVSSGSDMSASAGSDVSVDVTV